LTRFLKEKYIYKEKKKKRGKRETTQSVVHLFICRPKLQKSSSFDLRWTSVGFLKTHTNTLSNQRENQWLAMAESSSFKDSRWSLHGMTALVTGGTRGIGFSIPLSLIPKFKTFSFLFLFMDFEVF
jgi:hypothetical protein